MTLILGIETSCDETAAAIVTDGRTIVSSIIATQIDLHAQYGGVFPEIASRAHVEAISPVIDGAMREAGVTYAELDAIAVTRGPGLIGSLLVGINAAKGLALATGKPLLGINHLEGHVYSLWLTDAPHEIEFPVVILIVSGGHTELLLMSGHGRYQRLGGTLDDAAGEAFDKVGRLLRLPFPGGPNIEREARAGSAMAYEFPRAKVENAYDFSFSGLKTAVMREATVAPSAAARRGEKGKTRAAAQLKADISIPDLAASFQRAAVTVLAEKTVRAAKEYGATEILIAGGVSANQVLRQTMRALSDLPVRCPPLALCTDNAAMIAAAAHHRFLGGLRSGFDMDVRPLWPLNDGTYGEGL